MGCVWPHLYESRCPSDSPIYPMWYSGIRRRRGYIEVHMGVHRTVPSVLCGTGRIHWTVPRTVRCVWPHMGKIKSQLGQSHLSYMVEWESIGQSYLSNMGSLSDSALVRVSPSDSPIYHTWYRWESTGQSHLAYFVATLRLQ